MPVAVISRVLLPSLNRPSASQKGEELRLWYSPTFCGDPLALTPQAPARRMNSWIGSQPTKLHCAGAVAGVAVAVDAVAGVAAASGVTSIAGVAAVSGAGAGVVPVSAVAPIAGVVAVAAAAAGVASAASAAPAGSSTMVAAARICR